MAETVVETPEPEPEPEKPGVTSWSTHATSGKKSVQPPNSSTVGNVWVGGNTVTTTGDSIKPLILTGSASSTTGMDPANPWYLPATTTTPVITPTYPVYPTISNPSISADEPEESGIDDGQLLVYREDDSGLTIAEIEGCYVVRGTGTSAIEATESLMLSIAALMDFAYATERPELQPEFLEQVEKIKRWAKDLALNI